MRLPEQKLWDAMKRNKPRGKDFILQRIENGVGVGIPDVLLIPRKRPEFWVELKVNNLPKRKITGVFSDKNGMRISQLNWHKEYAQQGGTAFILAQVNRNGALTLGLTGPELLLIPGKDADDFNDAPAEKLVRMAIPCCHSWPDIYAYWSTL